jgi:hypothetical protein
MSTTYPLWNLTTYPDVLDKSNSNIRQDIVNFENRTSSTDPQLYYLLSDDVKSLQQSVFAIEETLGVLPQSTYGTVTARIAGLEDYTDLDTRYGGSTWRTLFLAHESNGTNPAAPTIMSHLHDGSSNGAAKIDLALHVNGKLNKTNINLLRTDAGGITGADIALNSTTDVTVAAKFDDKLDKTGGIVAGANSYLTVNSTFNSRMYKELDAKDTTYTAGSNVADVNAFSGITRKAVAGSATGNLVDTTIAQMRYADYSMGIRAKVSDATITQSIGKIKVYSAGTLVKSMEIIPNSLFNNSNKYEMIYVPFSHNGSGDWTVRTVIEWYGSSVVPTIACDLSVEGIMITPVHVTAYDME